MSDVVPVIRTFDLTKRFGRLTALDGVNLEVRRGEVFGFLGPNGAGKTTTIAILLGLVHPSAGSAEVLGCDVRRGLSRALRRVGAIVETPAFYPYMSGEDNLRVFARVTGGGAERRIPAVLEQVGLKGREKDKAGTYSLGMRQRLGLAAALVGDPELLILDEPTNGLDPAGMREVRQLIRNLGEMGKTVFVSSHLLHEVEQTCTHVGILKQGRLLAQQPVSELLRQGQALELEATDGEAAERALAELDWVTAVTRQDNRLLVQAPLQRAADVSRILAEHGIYLSELRPHENTLEEFFLEVTGAEEAP